ncbi:MAG: GNAT family N-acetyltransferase [Chloroflexi bacterium]|nr:MAG: GNAT family N-acetyltransferase [Chloroflexota bacterium]
MQTEIFTDNSVFDALQSEWDDLLERSVNAPFFMRYRYQRTWWQYLGHGDLQVIAIRTDEGRLVGLAPLWGSTDDRGERRLSFVGCVDISDYLDLLVDRDYIEAVHQTLLDTLTADRGPAWDRLYLCSLPHHSLTHTRLADLARARGLAVEIRQQDVCPVITLPATWDDYLAALNKKQRHEIRRKLRKIQNEAEMRWYAVESPEEMPAAMEVFIDLHQRSTRDKEGFWTDELVRFFKAVAVEIAAAGWLKLYFIELDGHQAAAMLCFDYNNEFLLYNSGYDPDRFASLSPGNVLTALTIQDAIRLGRRRYDFLRGDEEYKFRFGAQPEPVFDLTIARG